VTDPELVVRPATLADIDAIVHVGHTTWPVAYARLAGDDYVQMGLAKWWTPEATRPLVEAGRCTVAEFDGTVVAVAAVGPLDGNLVLFRLYVLPTHQGDGIGARLLRRVEEQARYTGHRTLRLPYLDGNDGAARFYARHGYHELEREPGAPGIPDQVWVIKDLWDDEEQR